MKAENKTTEHNRTIRLTEIPDPDDKRLLPELTITINYIQGDGVPILDKAVTLDSVVIPLIIEAINSHRQ